jgi:hypothetical protein
VNAPPAVTLSAPLRSTGLGQSPRAKVLHEVQAVSLWGYKVICSSDRVSHDSSSATGQMLAATSSRINPPAYLEVLDKGESIAIFGGYPFLHSSTGVCEWWTKHNGRGRR